MYVAIIVLFFSLFLYLAYRKRSNKSVDHEGEPDTVNTFDLVITLLATAVGGGLIFGLIGFGMVAGTIGVLLALAYLVAFIGLGMLAPVIRRAARNMAANASDSGDFISIPGLLARKYNKAAWGIVLGGYSLIYTAFLAAQYVALSELVRAMDVGIPRQFLVVISALTILAYVSLGGYRAVLSSDILQMLVIFVILLGTVAVIWDHGAIDLAKLPDEYWDPFASAEHASTFVWLAVFLLPTLLLRLDHWQRIVTANGDKVARRAYIIAGFVLVPVFLALLSVGAATQVAGETSPFFLYKHHILGDAGIWDRLGYGLVFIAFVSAVLSSGDTILNSAASNVVQSLRSWKIVQGHSAISIVAVYCFITLAAMGFALVLTDIVGLITEGFKIMTVLLPTFVMALARRNPSSTASCWSVVSGLATYAICRIQSQDIGEWAYIAGFLVACLSMALVSRVTYIGGAHPGGPENSDLTS